MNIVGGLGADSTTINQGIILWNAFYFLLSITVLILALLVLRQQGEFKKSQEKGLKEQEK